MITQLYTLWALFFGIALITIGNGLQGTILGVRGTMEGFSVGTLGFIMSSYYLGFLLGSFYVQKLILKVGHIRVFAAFASVASISILGHSLIFDPLSWGLFRLISGFSFAGIFVVAESWLNDQSQNEDRGKILSIYMAINHGGFLIGQLFLNLAHPGGFTHFILISILLSFALIPILVTASPFPSFNSYQPMSVSELYHNSPTALVGGICVGVAHGCVWGLGPVYAFKSGFDVYGVSIFMGVFLLGGFIFQWPIGMLSDKFDRRSVLFRVVWSAAIFALACSFFSETNSDLLLFLMFVFGGLSLPLYSLCIAHANDKLDRSQMVSGSSTMVLMYGCGALFGPLLGSLSMELFGRIGFFYQLTFVHIILGIFVFARIKKSAPVPLVEQEEFIPVPSTTSPMVSNLAPNATDESPESTNE
ncbi:MAG: MFS transporter [Candidatus Nitronauta litoralis]|uniref:MFS transporter n=1 Tax=Candidatus Nitronauta litoralis TaxID=2705533 RepID=A0A7T0BU60_9BACT|nr:MAG: MFS transporter [Candidatus Nitronauta litoralis]